MFKLLVGEHEVATIEVEHNGRTVTVQVTIADDVVEALGVSTVGDLFDDVEACVREVGDTPEPEVSHWLGSDWSSGVELILSAVTGAAVGDEVKSIVSGLQVRLRRRRADRAEDWRQDDGYL